MGASLVILNLKRQDLLQSVMFIGGEWCGNEERFPVVNPSDGERLALVDNVSVDTAKRAIDRADQIQRIAKPV